jgi:TPR repeat protein
MMLKLLKTNFLVACCILIVSCTTTSGLSTIRASELQQGKRLFAAQLYKRAMNVLLPLATDGIAEAQYAVGYMYYYGYGVQQDTETGSFWIKRSANQSYAPAIEALKTVNKQGSPN